MKYTQANQSITIHDKAEKPFNRLINVFWTISIFKNKI